MLKPYLTGVIEGYYGRQWEWSTRHAYADYLAEIGLNSFIYCPKGDNRLRREWSEPWPAAIRSELERLAKGYRERGLHWGVGLSPYALYREYGPGQRRQLRDKLDSIDQLGGDLLAILFDDMPGDCPELAVRQAEIVADIEHWSCASRLLVCPTYYSFDPVLERFFGPRPARYWEELGKGLPAAADIFWTGDQVCAETIGRGDIEAISAQLGRAPVLWDNYPVNDGEKASRFLHLDPLHDRESGLQEVLSGHFCNPMNQGLLSRIPLLGLAGLYADAVSPEADAGWDDPRLGRYFSADLLARLRRDRGVFAARGLDAMDASERARLSAVYRGFDDPAALEIVDWLEGRYAFDPACLTG